MRRRKRESRLLLPPKIYFHAFSGKAGILSSIFAACDRWNVPRENVYFGFAPVSPPPSSSFSHVSLHLVYRLNILYPPFVLSSPPLSLPSLSLPPPPPSLSRRFQTSTPDDDVIPLHTTINQAIIKGYVYIMHYSFCSCQGTFLYISVLRRIGAVCVINNHDFQCSLPTRALFSNL